MTDPVFLTELADPLSAVGDSVVLGGDEGRHAVVVRRIRVGETVVLADGAGRGVRGPVVSVEKASLAIEVVQQLMAPPPGRRYVVVQGLAKGDRSELAIEMMTEVGVSEIIPWAATRSMVRWAGERAEKALGRWRSTAREAAKQSRRLRVPVVRPLVSTSQLLAAIPAAGLVLVLHEEAETPLRAVELPGSGDVWLVVGPEGGVAPEELATLVAAGAQPVLLTDGVLRTSTAGVVALAALMLR